jgi:DNA primase
MTTLLTEVKRRLDIADVVGRYVPLQPSGKNFKARCPFHSERTPSFYVFPETQTWRCFGACATGGDAVGFVMRQEGLSFSEALRKLAEESGVAVPDRKARLQASPLVQANREAAAFYHDFLQRSSEAQPVRDYVQKRGFTTESVQAFQLGLAPQDGEALKSRLLALGFAEDVLVDAGLLIRTPEGRSRDRFRGRLIFPIWDAQGQVVGFSGRSLDGSEPKYMNTPKTPLFDKGHLLYGLHRASEAIRTTGTVVVVEGYTDVIGTHQAGHRNVVASMGTALTQPQVAQLESLARTCVLALDPDAAGQEATFRSLETSWRVFQHPESAQQARGTTFRARERRLELKVAALPDGKDPDELALAGLWADLIASAKSLVDFLFEALPPRYNLATAEGRREVAERLGGVVVSLPLEEQEKHLARLERLVGVDRRTLDQLLGATIRSLLRQPAGAMTRRPSPGEAVFRRAIADPLEQHALRLLLTYPELRQEASNTLSAEHFLRSENREIFTAWLAHGTIQGLELVVDPLLQTELHALLTAPVAPGSAISPRAELLDCLHRLEERRLRDKLRHQEPVANESDSTEQAHNVLTMNQRLQELFAARRAQRGR